MERGERRPFTEHLLGSGPLRTSLELAAMFAALFVIYGVQLTYLPVWLNSRGLSPAEISFATSAPTFLRLIVTPGIGFLADRAGAHRLYILGLCWTGLALLLVLSQLTATLPIVLGVIVMLISLQTIMPLTDTLTMRAVRKAGVDYGRIRLWGSATFILASYIAGFTVAAAGPHAIIWLIFAGALLTAAAAQWLPVSQPAGNGAARPLTPRDMLGLVSDRRFVLFLLCASTAQASHAVFYVFGVLHWRSQGLGAGTIGTLWALSVVAEIVLLWASQHVVRIGPVPLMLLGCAAGLVRWTAMAFDPPVALLFPLQILHAGTFAATHLGAMHWIARNVPEATAGTAQSFFSTASAGIGMGLAILLAGWLYTSFAGLAYLGMTGLCVLAATAGLLLWKESRS